MRHPCVVYILFFHMCVVNHVSVVIEDKVDKLHFNIFVEHLFWNLPLLTYDHPVMESLSDNWESSQNVIQNSSTQLLFF